MSRLIATLSVLYLGALVGWILISALIGDRTWWSFLLNALALYLFAPLALLVAIAIPRRASVPRVSAFAGIVVFLVCYGNLYVPPALRPAPPPRAPRLTAMTFNVLKYNAHPDGVAAAVRRSGADLVGLQEANPGVVQALRHTLATLYPYQVLGTMTGGNALVLLSRYPLWPTGIVLPGQWENAPLVARMRFAGTDVTVLDVHPISTLLTRAKITEETAQRAYTATVIADFVRAQATPVLVLSDFNVGDQSTPYRIVRRVLGDAWREGGFGFGHTFPGAASPGSSRPRVFGQLVPMWLVRIDYVFHSRQWQTVEAHIGPWDGVSDHRPVVATLVLTGPGGQE